MISKTRLLLWLTLAAIGIGGVALIAGADLVETLLLKKILEEAGVALIIAAVLAGTIDVTLKIELARDAFYAAFRYVLPSEMKEEVKRIIDYRFICTEQLAVIEISEIDSELVRVDIRTERTLKNISRQKQPTCNRFAIDDWGFPNHQSRIDQCTMELSGARLEGKHNPDYSDVDALGVITDMRDVKPDETVKFVSRGSEVHRNNGVLILGFRVPTVRPLVELRVPAGFKHKCSFGIPEEQIAKFEIVKRYRLEGTQFPGQNTWIRWWKEPISAERSADVSQAPPS